MITSVTISSVALALFAADELSPGARRLGANLLRIGGRLLWNNNRSGR